MLGKRIMSKTVKEAYEELKKQVEQGDGDLPLKISIPFRDGVGSQYVDIRTISVHSGIVDMYTTVPVFDNVERKKS